MYRRRFADISRKQPVANRVRTINIPKVLSKPRATFRCRLSRYLSHVPTKSASRFAQAMVMSSSGSRTSMPASATRYSAYSRHRHLRHDTPSWIFFLVRSLWIISARMSWGRTGTQSETRRSRTFAATPVHMRKALTSAIVSSTTWGFRAMAVIHRLRLACARSPSPALLPTAALSGRRPAPAPHGCPEGPPFGGRPAKAASRERRP